jgi:uncharacterized membrane protein (UPF0127 family)
MTTINPWAKSIIKATLLPSVLLTMPAWGDASSRQALVLDDGQQRHELHVEVARTASQRARGLMERESLPAEAGMLFVYDSEQSGASAYWMYKTRIPLDIAFVDSDGVIRSLKTMSPCHSASSRECPVYPAGAPFRAALEANAGYFSEHEIEVGDRIELAPWLDSP